MEKDKKKGKVFKLILLIYASIWVVVTVVVSVKLWDVLAVYQKDYEKAKESSNPDLVVAKLLHLYSENEISADDAFSEVSIYENEVAKVDFLKNIVKGKVISFVRNEEFKDRKPSYNIVADKDVIGKITLKQMQESDNFGFHMCEMSDNKVYVTVPELKSVQVLISPQDKLYINDKEVTSEYKDKIIKKISAMALKAVELTGISLEKNQYTIEGFLVEPKVEVLHDGNKVAIEKNMDGIYEANTSQDVDFLQGVEEQVLKAGETYILNTNQMTSFSNISKYLESGSKAYEAVQSVQSGLAWAGKPDELKIVDSEILEIKKYSDTVFTAKTRYKIHRVYRSEVYDEEMSYEWLYVLSGNRWLIRDFSLAN